MRSKKSSGFTLIELAVVIFIIGLLASVGLSALNAQLANSHISDTKKKQEIIKDALITYLGKNKRLPCPATDNLGNESRFNSGVTPAGQLVPPLICTGNFGYVPYATLGLPKSTGLDGWDNFFSYGVSSQWTLTYSSTIPTVPNVFTNAATMAFNAGIFGTIRVDDRNPPTGAATAQLTPSAAFIIISHGKNGLGALTFKGTQNLLPTAANEQDELANVPIGPAWAVPPKYIKREYTDIAIPTYGAFDDIILYLNSVDILAPLAQDGAIKSAEAQWADQAINISNSIGSFMIRNTSVPCSPPTLVQFPTTILTPNGIPSIDPWGRVLNYVQCISALSNVGVPTPINNPTQFINASTGAVQTYNLLCTTDSAGNLTQLAFAVTATTDSTTVPPTMVPLINNFTVAKFHGANLSLINSTCP